MPLDPTASITIAGVTCWDAGTEEEFSRAGQRSQAVRSLLCAWADRVPLINAVLSPPATTGVGTVVQLEIPSVMITICAVPPRHVPP